MILDYFKKSPALLIIIFCILYIFFSEKNPCTSPITYSIKRVDPEFGISKQEFQKVVEKGVELWSKPFGKTVFVPRDNGELTINLIYDERQQITQTNAKLEADAVRINELAESVKQQYVTLEEKSKTLEQEYAAMVTSFKAEEQDYVSQVDYWNTQGGAPEDIYRALVTKKDTLVVAQNNLEIKRNEVNTLVQEINTFIGKYNLLVNTANANIKTINAYAGTEFEEGIYNPNTNEITIYEFSTEKKLLRVVAHELGHALSLPHNTNEASIMYALNQANTLTLSKEDLASLTGRCEVLFPFINFYNNIKERYSSSLGWWKI